MGLICVDYVAIECFILVVVSEVSLLIKTPQCGVVHHLLQLHKRVIIPLLQLLLFNHLSI